MKKKIVFLLMLMPIILSSCAAQGIPIGEISSENQSSYFTDETNSINDTTSEDELDLDKTESELQCDYYINNNCVYFTRDKGKTWIESGLSNNLVEETLEFYRSNRLLEGSYTINPSSDTIAFFYGGLPVLRISHNNGASWVDYSFDIDRSIYLPITRRIVHFYNNKIGYVAMGSNYSMGSGELKLAYVTYDGGETWEEINIYPYSIDADNSSLNRYPLTGLYFQEDLQVGILSLRPQNDNFQILPNLYYTEDGGQSWKELTLGEHNISMDIIIERIKSLQYENGEWILAMGQENYEVKYTAASLADDWIFSSFETNIQCHTVG